MPIIEKSFEQRSEAWFKARAGNPGASEFDMILTSEGKPSKQQEGFLFRLASEKIRGKSDETYQSLAMLEGQIKEDEARDVFSFMYGLKIQQVAMVYKDERKLFHASADGLIGKDSGIEIKCPTAKVHAQYLYEGKLPRKYFVQIQGSLYVSERKYWWFMSYCDLMRPLIIRVNRDEKFIQALDIELKQFVSELDKLVEKIK